MIRESGLLLLGHPVEHVTTLSWSLNYCMLFSNRVRVRDRVRVKIKWLLVR